MITATYSPEDNKIRLYPSERLDAETFERVKSAGFKWAPRQELFVAPKWSCAREDLAIELAGEIEPEGTTLAERAQAKADRLDGIAQKRALEAGAFQQAARDISERFAMGQPILVGHHSERKARKDREKMDSAASKAAKAHQAIGYWLYRAEGVERHANHKNAPGVRARRIKTLLAELRDLQRRLNENHKRLDLWENMTTEKQIRLMLGSGNVSWNLYNAVESGEVTPEDARAHAVNSCKANIESPNLARWINHTLNRLSYERELLGDVPRYAGEITPTLLQMFVREHGADKPKGAKVDDDLFSVEAAAPLPAHIANGPYAEMTADEWRDLMQACGYVVPDKKPAKPPILNFKAASGTLSHFNQYHKHEVLSVKQVEMTKAQYSAVRAEQRGTRLSTCGQFRFRTCPAQEGTGPRYSWGWVAVFITDQKAHAEPSAQKELI